MEFPIGISSFKELIKGDYFFVDKTLMIKDIVKDGGKVIVLTRPRRFGKTLNLSMLYHFLRKNHTSEENLFEGLKISEDKEFCQKHQQQYPVIFVSFKDIKENTYTKAYKEIEALMQKLYQEHRYLLEGDLLYPEQKDTFNKLINKKADETEVQAAMLQLSAYMKKRFKVEPFILIDEYDTPIQHAYLQGYYDEMITLMRSIFGQALKDNDNLGKAVVTGITRIAQESLFSGVNNLKVYSLLREEYGQYFGFLEEEVIQLLNESKKEIAIESIKEWYNGYQIGKYVLYNPWSIINCLDNKCELKSYWVQTASNTLLSRLLGNASFEVKQQIEELLQGNTIEQAIFENLIFPDLKTREGAFWSLLLYTGYLKVLSTESRGNRLIAKLSIPNKEVSNVYVDIIEQWFNEAMALDTYDVFMQSLANGNMIVFKKHLSDYLMHSGSYIDFNENTNEQTFHTFVLGLVAGLREHYSIHSNKESGLGRCDVILIPKNKKSRGILLEFKKSASAELMLNKAQEALEQVKDKLYAESFKEQEVNAVLIVGLGFYGKQVELVHETIAMSQN